LIARYIFIITCKVRGYYIWRARYIFIISTKYKETILHMHKPTQRHVFSAHIYILLHRDILGSCAYTLAFVRMHVYVPLRVPECRHGNMT
jgi:hypothetical protein